MVHHEIKYNGRLAIFTYMLHGQLAVLASGYLLHEENQTRLYLTSLSDEKLKLPPRLLHMALAMFVLELGASHLVPVSHAKLTGNGDLSGHLFRTLPEVTLTQLEAKLARQYGGNRR